VEKSLGLKSVVQSDAGVELKGVRSGVERRRGVGGAKRTPGEKVLIKE
jgi:hypothetical protein